MTNVPVWVYFLFFGLLYIGIKRCFTRVISVKRLAIIFVVFILLNLRGAFKLFEQGHVIFAIEFFMHYAAAVHSTLADAHGFHFVAAAIAGALVGVSIGRNSAYLYQYRCANTLTLLHKR